MDKKLNGSADKRWLLWSSLYAAFVIVLAGVLNYTQPYSNEPVTSPTIWMILLWGLLYLPVIALPLLAKWKVTDFGFTLNPILALVGLLFAVFCGFMTASVRITWSSAVFEAYARTGEEVFFRGFLIFLFIRLFATQRRPWLWAAVLSSVLFTLVHTQTFQASFLSSYSAPTTPAAYKIFERLLNVFIIALGLALLLVSTRSILPGAIIHCFLNAGPYTLLFVLILYFGMTGWARLRGEQVVFGLKLNSNLSGPTTPDGKN